MTTNLRVRHVAGRPFAIVSGVSGLAAGVCFAAFLASGGPGDGLTSAGLASGVLGSVQMVALAPVALALIGRMPAAPAVRIAVYLYTPVWFLHLSNASRSGSPAALDAAGAMREDPNHVRRAEAR